MPDLGFLPLHPEARQQLFRPVLLVGHEVHVGIAHLPMDVDERRVDQGPAVFEIGRRGQCGDEA